MGGSLKQGTRRCSNIPGIHMDIVMPLQQTFNSNNALNQCIKTALDGMTQDSNEYRVVIRADKRLAGEHARRFNAPVTNEVTVLLVEQQHEKRDSALERIAETHRSYDALQHPLIFRQGQDGYHFAYHLMLRVTSSNHILICFISL